MPDSCMFMPKLGFTHPLARIFERQRLCRNIGSRLTVNIEFLRIELKTNAIAGKEKSMVNASYYAS